MRNNVFVMDLDTKFLTHEAVSTDAADQLSGTCGLDHFGVNAPRVVLDGIIGVSTGVLEPIRVHGQ